jgi:hypothetical protein
MPIRLQGPDHFPTAVSSVQLDVLSVRHRPDVSVARNETVTFMYVYGSPH